MVRTKKQPVYKNRDPAHFHVKRQLVVTAQNLIRKMFHPEKVVSKKLSMRGKSGTTHMIDEDLDMDESFDFFEDLHANDNGEEQKGEGSIYRLLNPQKEDCQRSAFSDRNVMPEKLAPSVPGPLDELPGCGRGLEGGCVQEKTTLLPTTPLQGPSGLPGPFREFDVGEGEGPPRKKVKVQAGAQNKQRERRKRRANAVKPGQFEEKIQNIEQNLVKLLGIIDEKWEILKTTQSKALEDELWKEWLGRQYHLSMKPVKALFQTSGSNFEHITIPDDLLLKQSSEAH